MSERWIVGVDGSIASRSALAWAIAHAPARRAEVVAVHAYRHTGMRSGSAPATDDLTGPAANATHELDVAVSDLVGERDIERRIVAGTASRVLIEHAADAALLVVGRHGVGGRWLHSLGSVSRYCATHASVPVVVVPSGWAGPAANRILVGFDGSDRARSALAWALEFARGLQDTHDVSVSAVAAIELTPWLDADQAARLLTDQLQAEERRLVDLLDTVDPDKVAERHVLIGSARDALARESEAADVVVLGAKGAGRLFGVHLGSVTTWMLENTPRPLVVVPTDS